MPCFCQIISECMPCFYQIVSEMSHKSVAIAAMELPTVYNSGIYAEGYIAFALTFVRSSIRMFVRSLVRAFVRYFPSRS